MAPSSARKHRTTPSRASVARSGRSSAGRSRSEAKAETRESLIRAGTELMAKQGLDVSLDAICARAGKTRGAFYVHFKDRDDLLVAVMDTVGRSFLGSVLSHDAPDLATITQRFLDAVVSGDYPLMAPGGVRPHQLLDACIRSPRVRRRYVALVADSIQRLATALRGDQLGKRLRSDLDARDLASVILATIIGAQTMLELGVPFKAARSAQVMLALLQGSPPR